MGKTPLILRRRGLASGGDPAVDQQRAAGHEHRHVRSTEQDRAGDVVSAAFRLPLATRRFSNSSPRISLHHPTIWTRHLRRITTASSMSQLTSETDASRTNDENSAEKPDDVVVQYVVLRRDLIDSWPLGSVVTQGCHASVAAIWSFRDDPVTLQYCDPQHIDSMHKVLHG